MSKEDVMRKVVESIEAVLPRLSQEDSQEIGQHVAYLRRFAKDCRRVAERNLLTPQGGIHVGALAQGR